MISWWYHDLSERCFRLSFVLPQTWGTCFEFFRPDYYPRMTEKFGNGLIFWPNPCNDFGAKNLGFKVTLNASILKKKLKFNRHWWSNIFKILRLSRTTEMVCQTKNVTFKSIALTRFGKSLKKRRLCFQALRAKKKLFLPNRSFFFNKKRPKNKSMLRCDTVDYIFLILSSISKQKNSSSTATFHLTFFWKIQKT